MRHSLLSILKTNPRWPLSPEGSVRIGEVVSPEVADKPLTEVTEEVVAEKGAAVEGQEPNLPEVPGTHRTRQRPVVTAITDTVRTLGTVWHP